MYASMTNCCSESFGTTFGDSLPDDLKFLELNNGTQTLTPVVEGNSITYYNYTSNQNGFERSLVMTPGEHHLEFRFGDDVEVAYNTAWFDTSFQFRKTITIDNTKVSGSSDHTDFPVLVSISSNADLNSANVQSNGNDIFFTDTAGTKIPHEIESFSNDASTGKLVAWVKVPTLSTSTDTTLFMYYGNAAAADQQDATAVWDSNYKGVWHLSEDPAGTAPQMKDSTSNDNDGTSNGGLSSADQVAGQINGSLDVSGGSDWIQAPHSSSLNLVGSAATVSAWAKMTSGQSSDAGLVVKATNGYEIQLGIQSNDKPNFRINANSGTYLTGGTTLSVGQWYFIYGIYDGSTVKVYVNGVEDGSTSNSGNIDATTEPVLIGRRAIGDNRFFTGIIDEVRMSDVARSTDWMITRYNNENSPSAFIIIDSQTISPAGLIPYGSPTITDSALVEGWFNSNWSFRKSLTIDNTKVSGAGSHTDFPVLVSITDSELLDNTQSSGNDILFTSADGVTQLSHEIESYNSSTGELVAWVTIPFLSTATDTIFYMYYGNSAAADQQDVVNTCDSNYKAVWHFK